MCLLFLASQEHQDEDEELEQSQEETTPVQPPLPIPEKFDQGNNTTINNILGLLDVYANYDSFVLEPQQEFEKKVGKLCFAKQNPQRYLFSFEVTHERPMDASQKIHSVVSEKEFIERFHIFTNNQLLGWNDWSNMVVIGKLPIDNRKLTVDKEVLLLVRYFQSLNHFPVPKKELQNTIMKRLTLKVILISTSMD